MEFHKQVLGIKLDKTMGLLILILGVVFPGWNTVIAGVLAKGEYLKPAIIIGLIQFLTCWLLVGWLYAIYVGWVIYKNS